jgi:DNA repair protein RecN (Recombination protein N)
MLEKLYIKDFAIVDELSVEFSPGFQVITGETGAGKSILIGALALICGERGFSDLIRADKNKSIIEVEFKLDHNSAVMRLLQRWQISPLENKLILRRELNDRGTSRSFVNDTPVSLANLSELSSHLIDLHGQHQHQRLLYPENHITYLDAYGGLLPVLQKYRSVYNAYQNKLKELETLKKTQIENNEKEAVYRFQIEELEQANLNAEELENIHSEQKILENSELLFETTKEIGNMLYSASDATLNQLTETIKQLTKLSTIDKEFSRLITDLESAKIAVEDAGMYCETYGEKLNFDPNRLNLLRERESQIQWFLKKYNRKTVEELVVYTQNIKQLVGRINNDQDRIASLAEEIERDFQNLQQRAADLSAMRQEIAGKFIIELSKLLDTVGLKNANFKININRLEEKSKQNKAFHKRVVFDHNGFDSVEFLIGINPGEPSRPLHKIASGGEVSRIMLCLKALLAATDKIPTLIFDEIDNGISGRIAQTVGKRMRLLGEAHQLIVISHLPQIAAQGTTHLSVRKEESNGRVHVYVNKLSDHDRIQDIAKLLGGEKITKQTIANARELLQLSDQ